jgi:AcrR family transcriptional regulator
MNMEEISHRRGRPRDPAIDDAILDAARTILARKGFVGTSMEKIARTAGVGKDTLYRRWRSKEELVRHLLTVLAEETVPVPDLDDPHYALFVFLQDIVRANRSSDLGPIIAGVVGESKRNENLAEGFRSFWADRRNKAAGLVRGILPADTTDELLDRTLDHILGPIYYRLLLTGAPLDDEYLWDLVVSVPWAPAEHPISNTA